MHYIALPDHTTRRLSFYLAMEEFVARQLNCEEDCFFMWQVEPSVIFGRNQLIENEVNLDYCRTHHIQTFRRKSGGGCVYADRSNVMFSYITRSDAVQQTFSFYINMVVEALRAMGIPASTSGRNDILVEGRKVSGNAFYHLHGHSIVHGTMLYDTCMEHMVGAITPSDVKLQSKGVQSVRQHIALLKDYTSLSLDTFKEQIHQRLCHDTLLLTSEQITAIETIEREYLSEAFIYGHHPRYTKTKRCRIEGVGEIEVCLEVKNNRIKALNLLGDYFVTGDINRMIIQPLIGCQLNREALQQALPHSLHHVIMNLQAHQLIDLLLMK